MPTVFCHSDIFVSGRANLTRAPPHGRGISTIPSASVVPPLGRVGQWCGDARPGVGPRGLRRRNGTRRAAPRPADHLGPAMEPRPIRVRPSPPIHPYTAGSARFRTGCGRGRRGVFVHLAILVPTWIDESTRQHPVGPADLNVARTSWVVVNSFGACPSLCWVGCMRMPWNVIASFSSVTYIQSVTPAYRWATMSTENQSSGSTSGCASPPATDFDARSVRGDKACNVTTRDLKIAGAIDVRGCSIGPRELPRSRADGRLRSTCPCR